MKHGGGGKGGRQQLHLGVDVTSLMVTQVLTGGHVDDASKTLELLDGLTTSTARFTAAAAYDTVAMYDKAGAPGAQAIVPPQETAAVSRRGPRSAARDWGIERVKEVGRRQWKKQADYHQEGTVESALHWYKVNLGDSLRARSAA